MLTILIYGWITVCCYCTSCLFLCGLYFGYKSQGTFDTSYGKEYKDILQMNAAKK